MVFCRSIALLTAFALTLHPARAQEVQIGQARQLETRNNPLDPPGTPPPRSLPIVGGEDLDSFGVQQFLKDEERLRPFRAYADVSAFVTNNVALAPRDPLSDSFLVATFGFEYKRALPRGFQIDASLRVATFRYDIFRQLDFTSVDVGTGLAWHADKLGGIDLFVRYNFNELFSVETEEAFLKNHTVTLGFQKAIPFSQAHYVFFGGSGQWSFADPTATERAEVSAFAGYHLQATRKLEADLFYRYSRFRYSENERADHNQTLSVAFRYKFTEWFSVSASAYSVWNRSNRSVFDYDAMNGGGGLTLSLQF